jgi:hypothetical protein
MGAGVLLDLEGDGDADLLFLNGTEWPETASGTATAALYRNDTLRAVPSCSPTSPRVPGRCPSTAWGWLVVTWMAMPAPTCCSPASEGSVCSAIETVVSPTSRSRPACPHSRRTGPQQAAWFDLDPIGDLDLFVGHYVEWSPRMDREVDDQLVGVGRAYGRPWLFPGTFPALYRK